jgi:hypothetical protein
MKKISLFISLMVILAACGPTANAVAIAQAQSAIQAARAAQNAAQAAQVAAQGMSDVGRVQSLILLLLTLLLIAMAGMAIYIISRRLASWQRNFQQVRSGQWLSGPNAYWKKSEEPDLYQQMLLEQHLLLSQLLSQGQEETDHHDLPDLPTDWWG